MLIKWIFHNLFGLVLCVCILSSIGCDTSDKVKIRDTEEAFESVSFEGRVEQNIEHFNHMSKLIEVELDSIFLFNKSHASVDKNKVTLFENTLEQVLPFRIAKSVRSIWQNIPSNMITAITLSDDGNMVFSIKPEKVISKPQNYKIHHKLYYGDRHNTSNRITSVWGHLSKSKSVGYFQYLIKVEPQNGW